MYSIQQSQNLKNFINADNEQGIAPSLFALVPTEIVVEIFRAMTNFRDFCSLALSSKFFYLIAANQNLQAANCPELVPYYFSHHANASLHHLPVWKKVALATQIENKLVSSEELRPLFRAELPLEVNIFSDPFHTTIIGDHLILTHGSLLKGCGVIYLYNLKTGSHRSLQIEDSPIPLCMAMHLSTPLLVTATANENGFKIWNFEQLLKADRFEQALLLHKPGLISYSSFNHTTDKLGGYMPLVAVSDHLLGVGDGGGHVYIFDGNHLLEPPLLIEFQGIVEQIEFFQDHLMIVSDKEIAIWPRSAILTVLEQRAEGKMLTLESATFTYTLNAYNYRDELSIRIAFAKVYQEKVVIAYSNGYVLRDEEQNNEECFKIGEVRNWKTGEAIRPLAHPCGYGHRSKFKSMDFKENFLFTTSDFLCKWDLEDTKNPFEKSIEKSIDSGLCLSDAADKVYSLGIHVLFVHNRHVLIQSAKDFSTQTVKEGTLLPFNEQKAYYHQPQIFAFDLKGKYLITITRERTEHRNDPISSPTLNVYDLSQIVDPTKKES